MSGADAGSGANEPSVEQRARRMGWMPQDKFRGDPEKFVSAEQFVAKGEEFIPFIRNENKKLEAQLNETRQQREADRRELDSYKAQVKELMDYNSEQNQAKLAQLKADLKAGIVAAKTDGDHATEVELQTKLTDLQVQEAAKKPPVTTVIEPPATTGGIEATAEFQEWVKDNAWWNDPTKNEMREVAIGLSRSMAKSGEIKPNASLTERLNAVGDKVQAMYAPPLARGTDKVGGGRGGQPSGGDSNDGPEGKSYSDLPADAKAACDRLMKNPKLVGEDKALKTPAAAKAKYLQDYFR